MQNLDQNEPVRRKIKIDEGLAAVALYRGGDQTALATSVRFLLEELGTKAEGNTVEVRVPPFGAVQCVEGPRHTRGTPPNVIEMSAELWVDLATGQISWSDAVATGKVNASGVRANLDGLLPLIE